MTDFAKVRDLRLLARHQTAAAVATVVDFGTMIALVELGGVAPPLATAFSATAGGVTNFAVGRSWAFSTMHSGSLGSQAARYAVTSAAGAIINTALLALVLPLVAIPYVVARAMIAGAVSIFFTYPMHARFVFRLTRPREQTP